MGGLELLTGVGRISPSHQHQKCIMNVLQTCLSRAVGAGFDVPLNDLGKSASQKVKHWSIEVVILGVLLKTHQQSAFVSLC